MEFNALESFISFQIWQILGLTGSNQWKGQSVTARMSFKDKVDLLESLWTSVEGDKKETKDLCRKFREAGSKRNDYLHGIWLINFGEHPERVQTHKINPRRLGSPEGYDFSKAREVIEVVALERYLKSLQFLVLALLEREAS